ncbi:B12-binding domain-containing radical SAM protein [Pseudomonas fluorescens]|uniref:B12-binding domain-containing radical SAM protein n=1 Tax=Pseudomonas fluorescens TaxID=294 RepID=UPI000AB45A65|nr:radical SAM protein [Pseudomonas fluorescens]
MKKAPYFSATRTSEPVELCRLALVALPYGEGPQKVMPLGLQNISAYVKKNAKHATCKIFDYSDLYTSDINELSDLINWAPHLVGISIYSSHVQAAITWGSTIKNALPGTFIFCGGPHISLAAEDFLRAAKGTFELALRGEGEHSTARLIVLFNKVNTQTSLKTKSKKQRKKYIYKNHFNKVPNAVWLTASGKLKESYIEKIQLPTADWENPLLEYSSERLQNLYFTDRNDAKKRKAIALTSSRGCPLACSFCAIVAADKEGPKWRAIDATTLVNWMAEAYTQYSFEHIYMMDANFFVRKDRVLEFSEKLYNLFEGRVTWSSSSTVGYLLKLQSELPKLVRQGLRLVEMGVESGSQSQLDYMNKKVTVQNNIDAVRALQNNRIDVGLDFIMFYHDQQKREIIENLVFLVKSGLTEHESLDHYFNIMMLYPETPVRKNLERKIGTKLDLLQLPNSRAFIENHEVYKIYTAYIDNFAKPILNQLEQAIASNIEKVGTSTSLTEVAYLSLLNIHLKHMPFQVLWWLCHNPDKTTEINRKNFFINYVTKINKAIANDNAINSPKLKIIETPTTGSGGRKGELIGKSL